jgi:Ca2+-binding RTX toxin-like protein
VSFSLGASWTATSASSNNGTATINANGFDVNVSAATGSGGWILTNASSMQGVSLTGAAGSDTLIGGGGNDRLFVTAGSDSLDGGGGSDTADFSRLSVGVSVTLDASGSATVVAGAATVTLNGIENLVGGGGADILTGNEQDNVITGGVGNDSLFGGSGNDLLAVQGLFNALDLPGLSFWLDGADLDGDGVQEGLAESGLNGTAVTQWNDKSGNGRHATQATVASMPTYTTAGLGGKSVVTFDGNDRMFFQGVHDAQWSIATVGRANGANQGFVQFGGLNSLGSLFTEGTYRARPTTGGVSDASAPCTPGENVILSATYGVSTTDVWKNGVIGTPASLGGVASNALSTIGSLQNLFFLNGFISEMVVTNGVLSTTDRQRLEGYLAHKWGLEANLPAGHPFKSLPPTV